MVSKVVMPSKVRMDWPSGAIRVMKLSAAATSGGYGPRGESSGSKRVPLVDKDDVSGWQGLLGMNDDTVALVVRPS